MKKLLNEKQRLLDFKEELFNLYKKYDLSIGHEDGHGSFEIEEYSENNKDWIEFAFDYEIRIIDEKINLIKELDYLRGNTY